MNLLHMFADKKEPSLSLGWLDDNFIALVNKCSELEDRLNATGAIVAEQNTIILQLNASIAKLQPKAKK